MSSDAVSWVGQKERPGEDEHETQHRDLGTPRGPSPPRAHPPHWSNTQVWRRCGCCCRTEVARGPLGSAVRQRGCDDEALRKKEDAAGVPVTVLEGRRAALIRRRARGGGVGTLWRRTMVMVRDAAACDRCGRSPSRWDGHVDCDDAGGRSVRDDDDGREVRRRCVASCVGPERLQVGPMERVTRGQINERNSRGIKCLDSRDLSSGKVSEKGAVLLTLPNQSSTAFAGGRAWALVRDLVLCSMTGGCCSLA